MDKLQLHHIEFYITNVCNLDCPDCRSFNNYHFKGHYDFNIDQVRPWANRVNLEDFAIIGGEPTLHPKLFEWMEGLASLWPGVERQIITNGTYLGKVKGLHDALADFGYNVTVGMHSTELRSLVVDQIFKAFGECTVVSMERYYNSDIIHRVILRTNRGVEIRCNSSENFQIQPFKMGFYNSDPAKAHSTCGYRNCHHMIDGKLYKCSLTATARQFLTQFNHPVPKLLTEYVPLSAEDLVSQSVLDDFQNYIPQCALCHETNPTFPFKANLKNKKVFKIESQ